MVKSLSFTDGIEFHFGPDAILARPLAAAYFANVVVTWSHIEDQLGELYTLLTCYWAPRKQGDRAGIPYSPAAIITFRSLQVLRTKTELIAKLIDIIATVEEKENFKRLEGTLRRCSKQRNKVAHGRWGVCEKFPDELILMEETSAVQVYTAQDFHEISNNMKVLIGKLSAFYHVIYERIKDSPTPEPNGWLFGGTFDEAMDTE